MLTTKDGVLLDREPVCEADLMDATCEAWMNGFLRRGAPDVSWDDLDVTAEVLADRGGFDLIATCRNSQRTHRQHFPVTALAHVAERASTRLVDTGRLSAGDTYIYKTTAGNPPAAPAGQDDGPAFRMTTHTPALRYVTTPLTPLLEPARIIGTVDDRVPVVLFTEDALAKADHYARKGAADTPPVETGCMLLGQLGSCPDLGELYLVVEDAIEVRAKQEEFALIYGADTWAHIQASLRCYQGDDEHTPIRMLGQAHGHNFGLDGEPCELCAQRKECTRTTVFVSVADRRFMRAVFARQPWALCWIAGTNARHEQVAKLYTLREGTFTERGYHVIPDLPAAFAPAV
jgi:hypothetical protein